MNPECKFFHLYYRTLILFFALILVGGCSTTRNTQQNTLTQSELSSEMNRQKGEDYIIQPGDEIEVSVWGYDEFNTKKTVTREGIISVPLVGEVEAEGKTKEEFEKSLRKSLTEYIKGEINMTVTIVSSRKHMVSVLGSVGRPDNYTVSGNMNLFQILSQAGGTTDQADLRSIKIYKGGQASKSVEIDLTTYLKDKNAKAVATIHPGDIVYVPQQENMVRELSSFFRDVVVLFGLFRFIN